MSQTFARILLWLFGLENDGVVRVDRVSADLLYGSMGHFAVIAGLALVLAAVCYGWTTESITWRLRSLLGFVRALAVALIVFALFGGVVRLAMTENVRQTVVFAVDGSGSMGIADVGGRKRFDAAVEALDSHTGLDTLKDRYELRFCVIGRGPREISLGASAGRTESGGGDEKEAAGSQRAEDADQTGPMGLSDLWADLLGIEAKYSPDKLRAVVLLSDGRDTSGKKLTAWRGRCPVLTVPVGGRTEKDARVAQVEAPSFVYAGDPLIVEATLEHRGLAGRTAVVSLVVDGKPDPGRKQEITLDSAGRAHTVRLETQQKEAGLKRFTVRVEPLDDEATAINNEQSVYVDVRPETIRVLYVEGQPRWEYRHIKDVLMTDTAIEPTFLMRITGDEWLCQGNQIQAAGSVDGKDDPDGAASEGAGPEAGPAKDAKKPKYIIKNPARGFPKDRLELFQFEVLILGDVSRKYLEGAPLQNIYEFVKERGGGLATLGGFHVYSAGSYETSLINQMLPVVIRDEAEDQFEERFQVFPSPVGFRHPAMRLELDPGANRKVWTELPVLEGGNILTRSRPGAVVLARHDTENERIVFSAHKFFEGRVFSSSVDTTYRWRLGRPEGAPDYLRRFWGQVVRWLAKNPHLRGRSDTLFADVNQYHLGSPVTLMTRMVDADYNPVEDAQPVFAVKTPSGRITRYTPRTSLMTPGLYMCRFVPDEVGAHHVTVKRPKPDGTEGIAQMDIVVEEHPTELQVPSVDEDSLRLLAESSGGELIPLEAIGNVSQVLAEPTATEQQVRTVDVRRSWAFFGLVVLLLSVEWFYRKRRGLS